PRPRRDRPAGNGHARRPHAGLVREEAAVEPRSTEGGDEMISLPVTEAKPSRPLVTIRDLRVELGGRPVLNNVTADILRGKVCALIGMNGSGKTTLLRAVVREYPFRGEIRFHCGHDHSHPTPEHI